MVRLFEARNRAIVTSPKVRVRQTREVSIPPGLTLPNLFAEGRAKHTAGSQIDVVGGRSYSSSALWGDVAKTIDVLTEIGVNRGERVLVQAEKSVSVFTVYLACVHMGAVFLPLNSAYTDIEAQWIVDDATPTVVIRDPTRSLLAGTHAAFTIDANGAGTLSDAIDGVQAGLGERLALGRSSLTPEAVACLLYTSGTTGRPKGAMLTHHNLASNAFVLREAWGFGPEDRLVHVLPIFHAHGLFVACNTVLASGASMAWLPRFDLDAVFGAMQQSTVFMGVPTHYTRMLADDRLNQQSVGNIRLFVSGSAPLLASTHQTFVDRTGQRILERYGMTETVMLTSNPLNGERRAGTVGQALPNVEVRTVDDHGRLTDVGAVGSVEVRGPNVFSGYWNRPDLTDSEFTVDGFFRTGDIGTIGPDGYLSLVGRAKDLVITGGLNVYPIEIEEVLDSLPGVLESAVIGIADADFGEAVVAVVVAEPGVVLDVQGLRNAARERLAVFKVPKQMFIVEALPRNSMGKVEKTKLRSQFGESVGSDSAPQ